MNSPHWFRRRIPAIRSALSLTLIVFTAAGTLLGPLLLPPNAGQAAPAGQQINDITLGKAAANEFSPPGQASYGEILEYTLRYTITTGTIANSPVITDTFGDPPGTPIFLSVVFSDSVGPEAMTPQTPAVSPVTPVVTTPSPNQPRIVWQLANINNTSGNTWIYELRYRVRVIVDGQVNNTERDAYNVATMRWAGGGPLQDSAQVILVQPQNFTFDKRQVPDPGQPLPAGAQITWTLALRTGTGTRQSTAYDVRVTDTMPAGTIYDGWFGLPPVQVSGTQVVFDVGSLPPSANETLVGIYARIPASGNVAHDRLQNEARHFRSSAPGPRSPEERTYTSIDSITAYIQSVSIGKSQVSPVYNNNSALQVAAGEYVTITVAVTVPQGIIVYNPWLRVFIYDGLTYTNAITPSGCAALDPPDVEPNPANQDSYRPGATYTQLTWTGWDSITDTAGGPVSINCVFQAQALQDYFVPGHPGEVPHRTVLRVVPLVRWSDDPATQPDPDHQYFRERHDNCGPNDRWCPTFIRPDLRYQSPTSGSYFEESGQFQGDGTLDFVLHLRQRSETPAHPDAHSVVLSDVLSPNLDYVSADPTPALVTPLPDGSTLLQWNVGGPLGAPPDQEFFTITTQLPPTLVAGLAVTTTAYARYETFASNPPNEGIYYDGHATNPAYTAQRIIRGGFGLDKSVVPNDNVKIGDQVTYTVVLTLNPGMVMYTPAYRDRLPRGFHYIAGSLIVQGGTVITGPVTAPFPTDPRDEQLSWGLDDVDNTGGPGVQIVTMTYRARLTGKDLQNNDAYASDANQIRTKQNADNQIISCWRVSSEPGADSYCLASPITARTLVAQPYLADTFAKNRPEWPQVEYEVGDTVRFRVQLRNSGQGPAYEIAVQDLLPPGLAVNSWALEDLTPPSPPVGFVDEPVVGETGLISWTLNQLAPGQQVYLRYDAIILSSVIPGDWLRNTAYIADYTSQPGTSNPYDRHYIWYENAFVSDPIPPARSGQDFIVLGVSMYKSDSPDPVAPGAFLTYTLTFGNSSHDYSANSVRITDTFDTNLTFVNYTTNKTGVSISQPSPNTIVWSVGSLPSNGSLTDYWIKAVFLVGAPMSQADPLLLNYAAIDGRGDMTGKVERTEWTTVTLPFLTILKSASPPTVGPGGLINYTIRFTNTGTMQASNVMIEEIYDPNVSFLLATPPPVTGTTNLWNWGDLVVGGSGTINVTVRVDRPVPAGVETVYNQARISCDEVYPVTSPQVQTGLTVPRLLISKRDQPDPVPEGANLVYTIRYTNTGLLATQTKITDTLGTYANTFISADPWPGNNCAGGVCIWDRGNLTPGGTGTIVLTVRVDDVIPPSVWRLTNQVRIGSYEVGPRTVIEYTQIEGRVPGTYIFLPAVFKGYVGTHLK